MGRLLDEDYTSDGLIGYIKMSLAALLTLGAKRMRVSVWSDALGAGSMPYCLVCTQRSRIADFLWPVFFLHLFARNVTSSKCGASPRH